MLEINSVTLNPNISKHPILIGKGLSGGRRCCCNREWEDYIFVSCTILDVVCLFHVYIHKEDHDRDFLDLPNCTETWLHRSSAINISKVIKL